jgi:hypothetical protein
MARGRDRCSVVLHFMTIAMHRHITATSMTKDASQYVRAFICQSGLQRTPELVRWLLEVERVFPGTMKGNLSLRPNPISSTLAQGERVFLPHARKADKHP